MGVVAMGVAMGVVLRDADTHLRMGDSGLIYTAVLKRCQKNNSQPC